MKIFRLLPVVGARRSHYELAVFAHDTSADEGDEVESTMLISTEVAHGKMQWQCSMSLDGFIAGPGGDMSWLTEHLGPNPTVDEVVGEVGALLVGNRTFRGDDPHKGTIKVGKPYGGGWTGPQFVLTHHAPDTPVPGVTFVGGLDSGVAAAKAAAGDKYVGILGAEVARQCLDAGVLDEILVPLCFDSAAPVSASGSARRLVTEVSMSVGDGRHGRLRTAGSPRVQIFPW
jgi:dihydrofolate reductase